MVMPRAHVEEVPSVPEIVTWRDYQGDVEPTVPVEVVTAPTAADEVSAHHKSAKPAGKDN